jgi:hypothetical protein
VECRRESYETISCLSCQLRPRVHESATDALASCFITHDQCRDPGDLVIYMQHGRPVYGYRPDSHIGFGCKQNRVRIPLRKMAQAYAHILNGTSYPSRPSRARTFGASP